jgi:hypothetical protein
MEEVIELHMNFESKSNFGFFISNFSRNAVPVVEVTIGETIFIWSMLK